MYFNHPYALRNTPEILELRATLGFESYSIYLMVLETIAESPEHSINGKLINGLSISFGCESDFLKKVLTKATELKLFFVKGDFIFSSHLQNHFEKRLEIKALRAEAGAKGGKAKANAKQTLANAKQNVAKESKVKKVNIKDKINNKEKIETFFESENLKEIVESKLIPYENQTWFSEQANSTLEIIKNKMLDYYLDSKKEIKDMKATFTNWILKLDRKQFYKYQNFNQVQPTQNNLPEKKDLILNRIDFESDEHFLAMVDHKSEFYNVIQK